MATASLPFEQDTPASAALHTGIAFAATVAIFYAVCAVLWLMAPGLVIGFLNSLFHGMDFSPLLRPAAFSWPGFYAALVVLSIAAFLAGTLFGWLRERLGR